MQPPGEQKQPLYPMQQLMYPGQPEPQSQNPQQPMYVQLVPYPQQAQDSEAPRPAAVNPAYAYKRPLTKAVVSDEPEDASAGVTQARQPDAYLPLGVDKWGTLLFPQGLLGSINCCELFHLVISVLGPVLLGFFLVILFPTAKFTNACVQQPSWAPPGSLFAPVWTVLYSLIGLGSWLVWKSGYGTNVITFPPLFIYACNLILNYMYTIVEFGFGFSCLSLYVISSCTATCVGFMATAWVSSGWSLLCFAPYIVWLSFASALQAHVVALNGCFLVTADDCDRIMANQTLNAGYM